MKVPTRVNQLSHFQLAEFPPDHVPDAVVALELPFYENESRESHDFRELFDHSLGDDDVDETEFILHQQKHSPFGALRLLTDGDEPGGPDPFAALQFLELLRVEHILTTQLFAEMLHWMAVNADAD